MRPRHLVVPSLVLCLAPILGPGGPVLRAQAGAAPEFGDWNIGYAIPSGWQLAQQQGRVHGLTPVTPGAALYVVPGLYRTFDEVAAELPKAFQALGLTGMPTSAPAASTVKGLQAMGATYGAQAQNGMVLQVRVMAVLTAHGSGMVVLGLAPPQGAAAMSSAVEQVAQSIEVRGAPVPDQRAIAALRGKWILYEGKATGVTSPSGGSSRSYEETVEFDGTGRFAFQSSASVSVTAPGMGGTAGGANASSDQGSYTVVGSTLVVRGQQGMSSYEIQILGDRIIADGRTYLRSN
ncbi:MAG: hypothetical protein OEW77_04685 [Gemmatimonadota bacterium]|nr:hypothetical protein [Gemmatimonadota bacterium]